MNRFSISKVLSHGKVSPPSASSNQQDAMDEFDISNVDSTEDYLTDSVIITSSKAPDQNDGEGITITTERPSYSNVPETISHDDALDVPDASKDSGVVDVNEALAYLVKPDGIRNEGIGSSIPTTVVDIMASPEDPERKEEAVTGQSRGSVPLDNLSENVDNVSESNSGLSLPSEVGSSILDEAEEKLLQDLDEELSNESHKGLTVDVSPNHASCASDRERTEHQLSPLGASQQSESHTVHTYMNVGNCLLESQEKVTKVSGGEGVSASQEQVGTWSQISSAKKWIKSFITRSPKTSMENSVNHEEVSSNTFTNVSVKASSQKNAIEPQANSFPPKIFSSQDKENKRESRSKSQVWKLGLGLLSLSLGLVALFCLTEVEKPGKQVDQPERLAAVPASTETTRIAVQDEAPNTMVTPLLMKTFESSSEPSYRDQWIHERDDDAIPDINDVSTPELSLKNDTLVGADDNEDVNEDGFHNNVNEPEAEWSHGISKPDIPSKEEAPLYNGNFLSMASKLIEFLRLLVAALTTGALGIMWLKTKVVPTKPVPLKAEKEGVPSVASPHGNRRRNYHPLPDDIDLTKYEELHVKDLRKLLSSRKLDQSGRKPKLISRLVASYEEELWSEQTVLSLRAILKKKNLKQGGLKHELIARLVEAGL